MFNQSVQVNNPNDLILEIIGVAVPGTPTVMQGTPIQPSIVPTLFPGYDTSGNLVLIQLSCSSVPVLVVKLQDSVTGLPYFVTAPGFWGWRP